MININKRAANMNLTAAEVLVVNALISVGFVSEKILLKVSFAKVREAPESK